MTYHYCYEIRFIEVPNVYFGARSCECLPEDDTSYLGSPVTYKHYWQENTPIKKILITGFETRSEANIYEKKLIAQQWLINKPLSLNASISGEKFHCAGIIRGPLSPERRQQISETLTGKKQSAETIKKRCASIARTFVGISPKGEEVVFTNAKEFCKNNPELNLHSICITNCARGRRKHHRGWRFYYLEDYTPFGKL
jgi:hypothetical protein